MKTGRLVLALTPFLVACGCGLPLACRPQPAPHALMAHLSYAQPAASACRRGSRPSPPPKKRGAPNHRDGLSSNTLPLLPLTPKGTSGWVRLEAAGPTRREVSAGFDAGVGQRTPPPSA